MPDPFCCYMGSSIKDVRKNATKIYPLPTFVRILAYPPVRTSFMDDPYVANKHKYCYLFRVIMAVIFLHKSGIISLWRGLSSRNSLYMEVIRHV